MENFYGDNGQLDPHFLEMCKRLEAFAESVVDCVMSQVELPEEDEQIVRELIESAHGSNREH